MFPSAAHRGLSIAEIVLEICAYLLDDYLYKTLRSFGLTCHALLEPSMDILWRDVFNFRQIVHTFPGGEVTDPHPNVCRFKHPLYHYGR